MKAKTARRARHDLFLVALLVLFSSVGARLQSQTFQQIAPKPVEKIQQPATSEPPVPPVPQEADPNEVLVPLLNELKLIPSLDRLSKAALPVSQPLVIEELTWLKRGAVDSLAKEFVGHPLTRGDLAQLTRDIVVVCRNSDRPIVDVFVPPQDVSSGVVQVVVLVGKLGRVRVEGNRFFADKIMLRQVSTAPGDELVESRLLGDIDRINQNPFRQVDLIYARGEEAGTTNLILNVRDTRPERVYAGYEDSGNEETGLGRVIAGFNLGNLWGDDQQASYQYTRSTDFDRLQAHSASYSVLLPWHDTINVFGDWSVATAQSDAGLFDLVGTTWQVGARYTIPLPIMGAYSQSLTMGVDYKWSNNDLAFGGTQVFNSPANIAQGMVSYAGSRTDPNGSSEGSITFFLSPGGIGGHNNDHDFAVQRSGTRTAYHYLQATFARLERLPHDYTLSLTALGQFSTDRLLPSEQFGLGGAASVRGYDERIVNGDGGISEQLELRSPSLHLLCKVPDRTRFLVFFDAGRDWVRDPISGERDYTFAAAGPGMRMNVGQHGTIKADYGWQLERLSGTRSGRPEISAIISF
jgi:hemolysin activation/secretion protein